MSDLETRIPHLLHDLVSQLPPLGRDLGRHTLRRARRRRATNASLTAMLVLVLGVGAESGLRALRPVGRSVGSQAPTPAPIPAPVSFAAIWPETNADDLAAAQAQVDLGHQPWRLDPSMTAAAWAVNLLGWVPERVEALLMGSDAGKTTVSIRNGAVVDSPRTVVELRQLTTTGPDGIWSVTGSEGEPIALEVATAETGAISITGGVTGAPGGSTLSITVLAGPSIEDTVGSTTVPAGPSLATSFFIRMTAPPDGSLSLLARLLAPDGEVLAGTALELRLGSMSMTPTPPDESLPPAVAATHDAILEAARSRDLPALATLLGPTFSFDFGIQDPIGVWRENPAMLDTMVKILDMPFSINMEGDRRTYTWPYFTQADLSTLAESQLRLLATIGVSERDVESMVRFQSGYLGPRIGISADGTWGYFVTSGD